MAVWAQKQLTVLAFVPCHESLAGAGGRSQRAAAEVAAMGKTFVATGNPERTNEEIIVYAELGAVKVLRKRADNHSHLACRMFS